MRHGKATWETAVDSDRWLTERGVKQAKLMGKYLVQQGVELDHLVVSPLLRAQQTAAQVILSYPDVIPVTCPDIVPESSVQAAQTVLEGFAGNVLMVSHLPIVANLADYLENGVDAYSYNAWPTAAVACLQGDILPGCMTMEWLMSPKQIEG